MQEDSPGQLGLKYSLQGIKEVMELVLNWKMERKYILGEMTGSGEDSWTNEQWEIWEWQEQSEVESMHN